MAGSIEALVKQLTDSSIIAPGRLKDFIPPQAQPKDADELIAELVKQNHLTQFQAAQIKAGKAKALILGNYTIVDKIGAGGMGQVFKAEHRRMKRVVAVKMLPPAVTKDPAAVARFQREVEAAAKLRHPNIVAADDADEANGVHFLVMEYVDGRDLSATVKKEGPLPVAKAVNCIVQAARGLEFAHKKGVVHRDIKPGNLLLDSEGNVKFLDMGLARIEHGDTKAQAELTGTGAIMGTVDYMAPEQGVSTKNADSRADIYSLGCTLHYLLLGRAPYDGETITAKLLAHHHNVIPTISDERTEVPPALDAVFKKMVAKRIEDRYQTMTEVIADLDKCLAATMAAASSATGVWNSSGTIEQSDLSIAMANAPLRSIYNRDETQALPTPAATQVAQPVKVTPRNKAKKSSNSLVWIVGGSVVSFALIALGVWIIVRDKGGKEVARVKVPAGSKVEVKSALGDPGAFAAPGQVARINTFNTPAFKSWMVSVVGMTADKQIEAVNKKLVELNPGFDGKLTTTISGSAVTGLKFSTHRITDLSPVRALTGLAYLEISGQTDASALHDLSPLQGMSSLTTLWCSYSQVTDLSPLAGRKLTKFSCGHTQVSSLAPLQGMPLTQLACYSTPISSLAPLKGMPLERLTCYSTKITDLSPLVGMPLRELDCSGCGVSDLTPLRGIPLSILNIKRTEVADLGPLFEMKSLGTLEVQGSRVTAEQVASLQKALPNCKIEWSGANQGAGGVNLPIAGTPAGAQSIGGLTAPARWQTLEFRPAGRSYVEVTGWKYEGKTPLTAEAWVRPRAIENRLSIIGDQEGAGFALLLAPAGWSNAMVFGAEKKAFNSRAVASIPVDQWSHLAMVYDESKISHYVNGKRQGAQVVVSMQYAPSTTPLLIGANPLPKGVAEEFFDGAIDEVRISSVARYTADFTPQQRFEPDDKTEVLYHFDEGAGTVAKDSSPHGRDGKIVGATWVTASSSSPQPSPVKGKGAGTPPPAVAPFDAAKAKAHQAAWAKYLGTPIETTNSIGMNMVLIPPGEFLMGSTDEQVETAQKMLEEDQVNRTYSYFTAIHHELPQHRVVLTRPFFMGCTEVTVGQFRKFVEAAKYITEAEKYGFGNSNATSPIENAKAEQGKNWRNPGYTISEDTPVGQITWNDAVAFCEWLTQQESGLRESLDAIGGLTAAARYRLPTEAEWEFACRAGTTTHYSFGDDRTQLEKYGWFKKNAGGKAQPVALKLPNSFGLFDMHGNSIEWCQDWHDSAWYAKSPVPNPTGPPFGSRHVIRGGDWVTQASIARSAIRSSNSATMRSASFGFRVVREIDALNSATAETKTPTK